MKELKNRIEHNPMTTDKQIQKHLDTANKIAMNEVERLARLVLKNNPKQVREFVMNVGIYFFIDNNDEIIHLAVGDNKNLLEKLVGYDKLVAFITKWDTAFGLKEDAMRFTATGKKITNW